MGSRSRNSFRVAVGGSLRIATLLLVLCAPALSQQTTDAQLAVTVLDQTGAVVPGAVVTVIASDKPSVQDRRTSTSEKGVAQFPGLTPGIYSIRAEFPGFKAGLVEGVQLRAGENKRGLLLRLLDHTEDVVVKNDPQVETSMRTTSFVSALTREQIDALSDDPDEMRRQLLNIAGPGATIRVDTFEGQPLPPKAQIKAIHITRDAFAAENHAAGGVFVDIVTQPGIGPLRGSTRIALYDSSFAGGTNPYTGSVGPAGSIGGGATLSGSLMKEKAGFSLAVNFEANDTTPGLYAVTPTGLRAENLGVRARTQGVGLFGQFDYSFTENHVLRVGFSRMASKARNQGVGAYDLVERAYATDTSRSSLRLLEAGPLGRRFFVNTRFSADLGGTEVRSSIEAPTVVVVDAFTAGGAQRAGGILSRLFSFASDLDYIRGIHSWRAGLRLDTGHFDTDETANYLGTYTFESLDAFKSGQPSSYTRRVGDPSVGYWNVQAALYLQDDLRISRALTISPGIRLEAQSHVSGSGHVAPRIGATWSPRKDGRTALRGSWGVFYDWLATATYEQTLRLDGDHQHEFTVLDPRYPEPDTSELPPDSRYLLNSNVPLVRRLRASAGLEQQVSKTIRAGLVYTRITTDRLLVGRNLNAPVGGVRPDPSAANVIEAMPLGEGGSQDLLVTANVNLPGTSGAGGRRLSWRRGLAFMGSYQIGKIESNADGAFSVPGGDRGLDGEWGAATNDVRHRIYVSASSGALRALSASVNLSASSGTPYTIWTGRDENGDSIFNDRPTGVGRNTARLPWRWTSYAYLAYSIGFRGRQVALPPGVAITSAGGVTTAATTAAQQAPRYRLTLAVAVQNLSNHPNRVGYSGAMTSPFFMRPTAVDGVRELRVSATFTF